jgi:hypothetical protein
MVAGTQRSSKVLMYGVAVISSIVLCVLYAAEPVYSSKTPLEKVLPSPACADGWVMEENITLYTRDTLFDRIDGEAELYFPYGFELLASARYQSRKDPLHAVEADVYRMGSLIDAFGIYANYRRPDDTEVALGAGAFISPSQLLFYQDRFFVRLQATGTTGLDQEVFLSCARSISQNLPHGQGRPEELDALAIPAVVKNSERYIARSLLGYRFLSRGLVAEAVLKGEQLKVFVVPEESRDAARAAFDQYRSYLNVSGKDVQVTERREGASFTAVDPLYKNVFVRHSGRYLIGVVGFREVSEAELLAEQLQKRLGNKRSD